MSSILTKHQTREFGPRQAPDGDWIRATVRYDDECGNGHNSFAITGTVWDKSRESSAKANRKNSAHSFGCCHEQIAETFPELAPFLKWHLTSSDGPMHYIANTLYHSREGSETDLDAARNAAVWPDGTLAQLQDESALIARLGSLLADFRHDVESLGLTY